MAKENILTSGKLADKFTKHINEFYPELNCIYAKNQEEVKLKLPEVKYVAGFNFLTGHDISHLKWIHAFSAGVDGFSNLNIPSDCHLTKTKGQMGVRMAEYCLTYMLSNIKRTHEFYQKQHHQEWDQLPIKSLAKQSVVIFGTGNISTDIAQVLQPLVKNIIGINYSGKQKEFFDVCLPFDQVESNNIDDGSIIINTLPATQQTYQFFNKSVFKDWKDILYINIGRGSTVNEADLESAIAQNQIRHAVLDVFKEEPLSKNSRLWANPGCTITPHISGLTTFKDVAESFESVYESIVDGKQNNLFVDPSKGY